MTGKRGKVWLVGAGPSDAGLMTLRGYNVLQQAESVVYDHLLGGGVLSMIPPAARKIFVGKSSGHHSVPQEEIIRILIEEAGQGRRVVRLKGGDPFLFGRGGEELSALRAASIPCEVVPGVSSAIAVPAYAGIPVTYRGYSSSVHIFTGHPAALGKDLPDFSVLAKLGGTLVFLMSVSAAATVCAGLLQAGMPPQTPAAAIENGTSARQRTICATLGALPAKMEEAGIHPPAVLVIGKTAALSKQLEWVSAMPLHGKRIVVTRPPAACREFCRKIEAMGGEAIAFPCIETFPLKQGGLADVMERIGSFTWITFSSTAGVDAFFKALFAAGADARGLAGVKIASVGAVTAERLRLHGIVPELVPAQFDGRHLGEELAKHIGTRDAVLVVRAKAGPRALEDVLRKTGALVETADAYETGPSARNETPEIRQMLAQGAFDFLTFASPSAVKGFVQAVPGLALSGRTAVCIGPETAAEARKYGLETILPCSATTDSMLETLCEL